MQISFLQKQPAAMHSASQKTYSQEHLTTIYHAVNIKHTNRSMYFVIILFNKIVILYIKVYVKINYIKNLMFGKVNRN